MLVWHSNLTKKETCFVDRFQYDLLKIQQGYTFYWTTLYTNIVGINQICIPVFMQIDNVNNRRMITWSLQSSADVHSMVGAINRLQLWLFSYISTIKMCMLKLG